MPSLDEELSDPELRLAVRDVIAEAMSRTVKSIGVRSLSREERRGMFATHLRTCVTEHPKLYDNNYKYLHSNKRGKLQTRLGSKCYNRSLCNHIISPDIWFDAGILRENLPLYLESYRLRTIMENVMQDSETDENQIKASMKKLEGGLLQMETSLAEMKRMNGKIETEANRLTTELEKL